MKPFIRYKMEVAETKLAQMTAVIQETESLKITNNQLHFFPAIGVREAKAIAQYKECLKGKLPVPSEQATLLLDLAFCPGVRWHHDVHFPGLE